MSPIMGFPHTEILGCWSMAHPRSKVSMAADLLAPAHLFWRSLRHERLKRTCQTRKVPRRSKSHRKRNEKLAREWKPIQNGTII